MYKQYISYTTTGASISITFLTSAISSSFATFTTDDYDLNVTKTRITLAFVQKSKF